MKIERMDAFFASRVDGYDEHMLSNVEGCREGYKIFADLVPQNTKLLLDLGCGTGLELEEILKRNPDIYVTGIDLTLEMLERLKIKYSNYHLNVIHGDYFKVDFGNEKYDVVLSFQTMHHFSHEQKLRLYRKVYHSLKAGGKYIECDYMVLNQQEEDFYFNENKRLREQQNIADGEYYHYDTPCSVENQIKLLENANFNHVHMHWRLENTTIIEAKK